MHDVCKIKNVVKKPKQCEGCTINRNKTRRAVNDENAHDSQLFYWNPANWNFLSNYKRTMKGAVRKVEPGDMIELMSQG